MDTRKSHAVGFAMIFLGLYPLFETATIESHGILGFLAYEGLPMVGGALLVWKPSKVTATACIGMLLATFLGTMIYINPGTFDALLGQNATNEKSDVAGLLEMNITQWMNMFARQKLVQAVSSIILLLIIQFKIITILPKNDYVNVVYGYLIGAVYFWMCYNI
jgi:hypothetical protein